MSRVADSRWRVFLISFVLSLAAMLLWSFASPLGSVPDEPSHFIRAAAVVRGQAVAPIAPAPPGSNEAVVPRYVAYTNELPCFAFNPNVSAGCQRQLKGAPGTLVKTTQTAEANSPAFYAVIGLPSLFLTGDAGLYGMRAVNSLLCSLMIGFMFLCASQLRRPRWAYVGAFASITPMVIYLGGSVNPNAIEATAAGALFSVLVVLFSRYSSRRLLVERLGIVVLSTAALVSTRSISLLWVLIAIGAALLFSQRAVLRRLVSERIVWVFAGIAAVACAVSLIWFVRPPEAVNPAPAPGVGTSFAAGFLFMIGNTFNFGSGWIGLFGWLDTPAPTITLITWGAAVLGAVIAALAAGRKRYFWAIVLLAGAVILTPAISQAAVVGKLGYIWQGRYILALTVMLMLACGFVLDRAGARLLPRTQLTVVGIAVGFLGFAHVVAFVNTLKRYAVGMNGTLHDFVLHPQWQPPGGWVLVTCLFAVVVALSCAGTILLACWTRPPSGVRARQNERATPLPESQPA